MFQEQKICTLSPKIDVIVLAKINNVKTLPRHGRDKFRIDCSQYVRISVFPLFLCTAVLPSCGHPIMQLERIFGSKGAKSPRYYRYRTWQDTTVRHTLSSFKLAEPDDFTPRWTTCLSRKHFCALYHKPSFTTLHDFLLINRSSI